MEFRTPLPCPAGASTLSEVLLYWELEGHHAEAQRLAALVAEIYRESLDAPKEGQCNCPCGCSHAFRAGDCQHQRFGAIVCDSCYLSCSAIRIVFNVTDESAPGKREVDETLPLA